ncbi:MAG: translation initiation factor IF-2 [Bacteroidota bacterium]
MPEVKPMRLSQVARKLNVGTATIVAHLVAQGFEIDSTPNTKITPEQYHLLAKTFAGAAMVKEEVPKLVISSNHEQKETDTMPVSQQEAPAIANPPRPEPAPKAASVPGTSRAEPTSPSQPVDAPTAPPQTASLAASSTSQQAAPTHAPSPKGLTLGKMELAETSSRKPSPVASSDLRQKRTKKPTERVTRKTSSPAKKRTTRPRPAPHTLSEKAVQEQVKNTLTKLDEAQKRAASRTRYRKEKRLALAKVREGALLQAQEAAKTLQVTEFIAASDLASLMDVPVNEVLSTCMALGMTISINQRLDAEAITIIADEFGYQVAFTDIKDQTLAEETQDSPTELVERAPIVTIMGHVDHGKTTLLDYIQKTQVTQAEAGGITQHIGAYDVVTERGKRIAFLDTPGHEAFTAMRARGAKLTDVAIIVVAADDGVRPQTKEAINHAQIAGVPLVFAINKIDKPQANPEKVKEELANLNILVEDWGGKHQSQAIAATAGQGVNELLEKVLFEAELLELKANPHKKAQGTVIEAMLDQGRGYLATFMVQTGTLLVGDTVLAGAYYGKVKAMFNHQGHPLQTAGPSMPVQMLGLDGAPQAGDNFMAMPSDKEARAIAIQRQQILREQGFRTKKHITLDEIGRRIALGTFKELNILLKGDVDGSVEALADALLKLSTGEIQINIVQQGVGAISESDILLAAATDAIVIGFQVRPAPNARKLAEKEAIEIRLYDIIYEAIDHIKDAIKGMITPSIEKIITGNAVVRETFRISRVGTVAGCHITHGYLKKGNPVHLIRDGIVTYTGTIKQIKRFKEEVQQVKVGIACGISIENFNDIKVEDIIEGFEERTVAKRPGEDLARTAPGPGAPKKGST